MVVPRYEISGAHQEPRFLLCRTMIDVINGLLIVVLFLFLIYFAWRSTEVREVSEIRKVIDCPTSPSSS